jgi:enoyl-CoA hydratase
MSYSTLKIEKDGRIARVVINRPERKNALTLDFIAELPEAFDELGADPEVRVIILKGAGSAFSVGFDHSVTMHSVGFEDALAEVIESRKWLAGLFRIWDCPKVVIAQLHGWAIGWGGLPLLFCDLRYASDEFKVFYAAGVTGAHLPEVWSWFIGPTAAAEFAYRPNHRFTADELCTRGLINEVFPLAELEPNVEDIAKEIAVTDPSFLKMQKLGLHRRWELMGFREHIFTTKDFDALLHWSKLGVANFDRLQNDFGGDRRKMTEAQDKGTYWDDLKKS